MFCTKVKTDAIWRDIFKWKHLKNSYLTETFYILVTQPIQKTRFVIGWRKSAKIQIFLSFLIKSEFCFWKDWKVKESSKTYEQNGY